MKYGTSLMFASLICLAANADETSGGGNGIPNVLDASNPDTREPTNVDEANIVLDNPDYVHPTLTAKQVRACCVAQWLLHGPGNYILNDGTSVRINSADDYLAAIEKNGIVNPDGTSKNYCLNNPSQRFRDIDEDDDSDDDIDTLLATLIGLDDEVDALSGAGPLAASEDASGLTADVDADDDDNF